jgi:hypothetical protein
MDERPENTAPESPPAWANYGTTEAEEDFIVGSPAGLRALRDHIERAIQTGESRIDDPKIEFNGIKCKQSPLEMPVESRWSSLAGYGCFVAVAVVAFAIYGFISLSFDKPLSDAVPQSTASKRRRRKVA